MGSSQRVLRKYRCQAYSASSLTLQISSIKYKRLKDKFGTASSGKATPTGDGETAPGGEDGEPKAKKKSPAKKTPKPKKRKLEDDDEEKPVKAEAEDVSALRQVSKSVSANVFAGPMRLLQRRKMISKNTSAQ